MPGRDPRFIFRRMATFAGEDIGMADPGAMGVVTSAWETFERIGMPEGPSRCLSRQSTAATALNLTQLLLSLMPSRQ
ncbi:MAG: hypothetical protein R3C44_17975 [Chloroflexota bacterium]